MPADDVVPADELIDVEFEWPKLVTESEPGTKQVSA